MIRTTMLAAAAAILIGGAPAAHAATLPATWDGLTEVKNTKFRAVYLLPGADFHAYDKIMFDPTEIDFVKGWVRNLNDSYTFSEGVTTHDDEKRIAAKMRAGVQNIWSDAFTKAGWQVVTTPGPDVLRVGVSVLDLSISAPFTVTEGSGVIHSVDAGRAVVMVQVRDSESGAILGRAVDGGYAGAHDQAMPRSQESNTLDFTQFFDHWADLSVAGLAKLKDLSPIDANAQPIKK